MRQGEARLMLRGFAFVLFSAGLVASAWATPPPSTSTLGAVDSSYRATLSGVTAEPGATVFDGDALAVLPGGSAAVNLDGGSRVALSADSEALLLKGDEGIGIEVRRGGALLSAPSASNIRALIGDATFSPSGPGPFVGIVGFTPAGRIVLYAAKGVWLATTAPGGRSVTLHPGEKLEGAFIASQTSQEGETPEQAQKKKKKKKWAFFWIGGSIAGTATGIGLAFGQSECTSPVQTATCPGQPVASPVIP